MGDFEKDTRTHHIHAVKWNGTEWKNYINFRDYLNCHPDKTMLYDACKKKLALQFSGDRRSYTQGKQHCIECLLEEADVWRQRHEIYRIQRLRRMVSYETSELFHLPIPLNQKSSITALNLFGVSIFTQCPAPSKIITSLSGSFFFHISTADSSIGISYFPQPISKG